MKVKYIDKWTFEILNQSIRTIHSVAEWKPAGPWGSTLVREEKIVLFFFFSLGEWLHNKERK